MKVQVTSDTISLIDEHGTVIEHRSGYRFEEVKAVLENGQVIEFNLMDNGRVDSFNKEETRLLRILLEGIKGRDWVLVTSAMREIEETL